MLNNIFYQIQELFFNTQLEINSLPLWFRITLFTLYSLAFGSYFGSVLNRRINPTRLAQQDRDFVLSNYGVDIAPELPENPYSSQKRSICPTCKHPLNFYHNIPLASYIILAGRCGFCNEKISKSYPIIESSIMGLMLIFGYMVDYQISMLCLWFLIFSISLVSICFTDIRSLEVYDVDNVAFCVSGISILNKFTFLSTSSILTAIYMIATLFIIASAWEKLRKLNMQVLGSGDLPLLVIFFVTIAETTALLSVPIVYVLWFVAAVMTSTAIINVCSSLLSKSPIDKKLPLAPALTIGTLLALLYLLKCVA